MRAIWKINVPCDEFAFQRWESEGGQLGMPLHSPVHETHDHPTVPDRDQKRGELTAAQLESRAH